MQKGSSQKPKYLARRQKAERKEERYKSGECEILGDYARYEHVCLTWNDNMEQKWHKTEQGTRTWLENMKKKKKKRRIDETE